MKSEIHGINCSCCEKRSVEAGILLDEINAILNEFGNVETKSPKQETIDKFKEVANLFSKAISLSDYANFPKIAPENVVIGSVGTIEPLVKLVEAVFSLPDGEIDYDILKLDPNKKVGGKKVSEIAENPALDISQVIDFTKIPLDAFKNLKIALVPPTIDATVSLGFGPLSIGIQFKIGIKSISWAPAYKFQTPEAALENLKGTKYKKMLTESGKTDLATLKKLAKEQFANNQQATQTLEKATSPRDFFGMLNMLGLNIFEEIDVYAEAKKTYDDSQKVKEINQGMSLPDPEETLPKDIGKIDLCADNTPKPAVYRKEEIEKVHDELCNPPVDPVINTEIKLPNVDLPNPEEEKKKVNDFLSKAEECGKKMEDCGKEKAKANNRWWQYYELDLLNDISISYFGTMRDAYETYYGDLQSILKKRDSLVAQLALLNRERQVIYDDFQKFKNLATAPSPGALISATTTQFKAFTIEGTAIETDLEAYGANPLGAGSSLSELGGTLSADPAWVVDASLNILQNETQKTIKNRLSANTQAREAIISQIEGVGTAYNQYKDSIVANLSGTIEDIRKPLSSNSNLISNLVGYNYTRTNPPDSRVDTNKWTVQVAGPIYFRVVQLWNSCKNLQTDTTSNTQLANPSLQFAGVGGVASPLDSYISSLALPEIEGESIVRDRAGLYELVVWKPFYSAKRIDYFYTYQEQGYNKPKPEYNEKGELLGTTVKKKIVNGLNEEFVVEVPQNADGLTVDNDVAKVFLETLDTTLKAKVLDKISTIKKGTPYKNFINTKLYDAAKKEAAKVFFQGIENRSYLDGPRVLFGVSHLDDFRRKAEILELFKTKILEEQSAILLEIEGYDKCIEDGKKCIEEAAKKLGGGVGNNSTNLEKKCKETLGSDPVGEKLSDGSCPSLVKNCYWTEYTKIMQTVSLLPIPELDPQNLALRLFRYYPVALQIPVPVPVPAVLPTLAMGIPDPLISIPLPLLWQHIITVVTPLGVIVVWIALAGPVPSPFVMLVDEKGDATFMVTSRGPCSIPHPTVAGLNPLEETPLLDLLLPKPFLGVPISSPLGDLLAGNSEITASNPDSGKNVIDKLKEKIKTSLDQLEIKDPPSIGGNSEIASKRRAQIKRAFELVPPDIEVIESAIEEVFKLTADAIDKIKISDIKIPKDAQGLMIPTMGPDEVVDNLVKAIDTASSAPAQIANQVLADIGMAIKTISLTKKLKEAILKEVDTPEMRQFFIDLDQDITDLEDRLSFDVSLSDTEKIEKRVEIIKEVIKEPLQKAIQKVSPETLGFAALPIPIPPLPFPCYTSVSIPTVPPYIYTIILAFQAAPSIIDSLDAKTIAGLVSFELDLSNQLPNAEQLFYGSINGVLGAIPDIEVPNDLSDDMFKQTIGLLRTIPEKFKIGLPKPGLPIPIIIPGSLIKTTMKEAAKAALSAVTGTLISKIKEAIAENKPEKVIAVYLIIKGLFGAGLETIKGADIKAFIVGMFESNVYPALDAVSYLIDAANAVKAPYLSIIELFQFPPKPSLPFDFAPYYEISTDLLKSILDPAILLVLPPIFKVLPPIVTLIGASSTPARLFLTKLHPLKPVEKIPAWEQLSPQNIPFMLWLDQVVATAQRKSGFGSTYLLSAGGYQAIP